MDKVFEFLGFDVQHDQKTQTLIVCTSGFRGPGKEKTAWGLLVEAFNDLEPTRIAFDIRQADYPLLSDDLFATFTMYATSALPTDVCVLCRDDQTDTMNNAVGIAQSYGHTCVVVSDECAFKTWLG